MVEFVYVPLGQVDVLDVAETVPETSKTPAYSSWETSMYNTDSYDTDGESHSIGPVMWFSYTYDVRSSSPASTHSTPRLSLRLSTFSHRIEVKIPSQLSSTVTNEQHRHK